MHKFNSSLHEITLSDDGSFTAYSKEYDEHYHSTKDGALKESLLKHIIPTMSQMQNRDEVNILDICFGLGFNTLASLYYHKQNSLTQRLNIYSPELDLDLIDSLKKFTYPKAFDEFKDIIDELSTNKIYSDDNFHIEIFIGDAREYVKSFKEKFDIVYQDAFSPKVNHALWTREYFKDIASSMKKSGILSTYSIALATRLALYENGFKIYINKQEEIRDATIASRVDLKDFELVDMEHKISCNPDAKPLRD
ncbi:MAG: MnmC family methyltransferase [Sulfurimonas sp.]|uniref:tRNA (5-methylaminomethyl-2-thiouridine)(34)-methyltransferase MnmD n=1 Tax=Sulfurimonas sp. TaxID=2022749 RepID=UPI0025EE6A5B|nr:MnmC family methyltransferase [Sulfurimonas sp.]MCK9492480.1 MnmC family methyltransferase [Sulfurimonas sp.]